jgi:hypothetical protein
MSYCCAIATQHYRDNVVVIQTSLGQTRRGENKIQGISSGLDLFTHPAADDFSHKCVADRNFTLILIEITTV